MKEIQGLLTQNSVLLRALEEQRKEENNYKWAKMTDISTELISLNTRVSQLSQINIGGGQNSESEEIKAILQSIHQIQENLNFSAELEKIQGIMQENERNLALINKHFLDKIEGLTAQNQ